MYSRDAWVLIPYYFMWHTGHPAPERYEGCTWITSQVRGSCPIFILATSGMSAFVLEDGVVYRTHSSYARGVDALWGTYQWLDRAPKGRNETRVWWGRHDEYDNKRAA